MPVCVCVLLQLQQWWDPAGHIMVGWSHCLPQRSVPHTHTLSPIICKYIYYNEIKPAEKENPHLKH